MARRKRMTAAQRWAESGWQEQDDAGLHLLKERRLRMIGSWRHLGTMLTVLLSLTSGVSFITLANAVEKDELGAWGTIGFVATNLIGTALLFALMYVVTTSAATNLEIQIMEIENELLHRERVAELERRITAGERKIKALTSPAARLRRWLRLV